MLIAPVARELRARRLASATSATNTKSRVWLPSPRIKGARPDKRRSQVIATTPRDPALGRQVQDRLRAKPLDGLRRRGTVQVGRLQLDASREGRAAGMTQIVEDQDGEAFGLQPGHGMHTDEARATGDQDAGGGGQ